MARKSKIITGTRGRSQLLIYSPKGDLLVSASADKTLRLWSAADGSAKGQFTHSGPIAALALKQRWQPRRGRRFG